MVTKKDAIEAERRRNQLLDAGFELFSTQGIESVSLLNVAKAAKVSEATMYNYFKNKDNLLIAISAKIWKVFIEEVLSEYEPGYLQTLNAYEVLEFYCDAIIDLYRKHPKILQFSGDYKTYICRRKIPEDKLKEHLDIMVPINELFHDKYQEAKENGSIRTDIPENEMTTVLSITMLGMAERYAQGIVWANDHLENHTNELLYLKEMLLNWVTKK